MGQIQNQMKAKLAQAGIPFRAIECYGSQIVITSACHDTANKWALLLGKFAKVRGVIRSVDYATENKGSCLNPSVVDVWRTFAAI